MKKLLFMIALVAIFSFNAGAQSIQVATLTHDGTITSYTGAYALRDAYNVSVDGDVITLSSGSFAPVSIEKCITIRGAGMGVKVNDSDPYIEPTLITGSFAITAGSRDGNNLKIEGLLCEERVYLKNVFGVQFSKCRFTQLDYSAGYGSFENCSWINCVLSGSICYNASMNFYGCHLKNLYIGQNSSNNITNCILEIDENSNNGNIISDQGCVVKNSIYLNNSTYEYSGNDVKTVFNSIWSGMISQYAGFYQTLDLHNNTIVPTDMQLFKEGTFFQLTDQAKQYLGDDGTEVGIYGGSLPFDPQPTNPQITKFNVAPKTTADGKLSVDIEVSAK